MYTPKPFAAPSMDIEALARMRAPPDRSDINQLEAEMADDSDEELQAPGEAPGAFPGSTSTSRDDSTYY